MSIARIARPVCAGHPSMRALGLLAAGAAVGALCAGGVAWSRASTEEIVACKDSRGYLYIPAALPTRCEETVTWNRQGPAGPPGPKGPPGPASAVAGALGPGALLLRSEASKGAPYKDGGGWTRQRRYRIFCPGGYDAISGGFATDWTDVYAGRLVTSEPFEKTYAGGGKATGWQLRLAGTPNKAPTAALHLQVVCAYRGPK